MLWELLVVGVDVSFEAEQGNVVVQIAGVVFRMDGHGHDVFLDLGEEFRLAVHVPLAQTDAQLGRLISAFKNNSLLVSKNRQKFTN